MPPDDLQLDELTNATLMKLEQFRDRTATGQSRKQHMYKRQDLHVKCLMRKCLDPLWVFFLFFPPSFLIVLPYHHI